MKSISVKSGQWAAITALATFLVWIICFTAISMVNPPFSWTGLEDYIDYSTTYNQSFKFAAQLAMLLFAPAFVVMLHSIKDRADEHKKFLTGTALSFGIMFAVCVGIHYFVQISSVRLSIVSGHTAGLEQFIQSNPYSGIAGINLAGWTLFFSLSCLFLAPVFTGKGLNRVIRVALIANAVFCLLGGFGYIMDYVILVGICLNLGLGGAMGTAVVGLLIYFCRLRSKH
ncbi:MAG: hypothetical protein JXR41_02570 [Bacteroidales bacterium]|nr:hypothetical protein [Bacteroidales bacterium]MBN2761948.1 hypothetical protein [Bacteroidales bacterium]